MSTCATARLGAVARHRWGLVTTAQAEAAGVSRKQLSAMAGIGALERVRHGVYRMAGAPPQEHETVYATWLALGGATAARTAVGVSSVVAAGATAAVVHDVGDFLLDGLDFVVPSRRGTRLPGVRLRAQRLAVEDVIAVNGLPTLTIERTIADLVSLDVDLSLVAGVVHDAVRSGRLVAPQRLVAHLSTVRSGGACVRPADGRDLANDLFELAAVAPDGWVHA